MRRKLIRLGGALVSIYSVLLGRVQASSYECVNGDTHINSYNKIVYSDRVCTDKKDGFVLNDPRLKYLWADCLSGDQLYTGRGCDTGWCTSSGLFCSGSGYFKNILNCRENDNYADCYYGTGQYEHKTYYDVFIGCVSGAYLNGITTPSITRPASSGYGFGSGICEMCSGVKYESGQFITYPSSGIVNSNNDFYWVGQIGESSCRAFSTSTFTDNKGTFTINSSGCEYSNMPTPVPTPTPTPTPTPVPTGY